MKALNDQRQGKTREAGEKRPFNGGLLPIELSLTMRGISGLKIGEAFLINEVLLPQRSRGLIGFSITGIDHSISVNNEWETNISTAMYNLPATEVPVEDESEADYVAPPVGVVDPPKETPNANKLRAAITKAGYIEKKKPENKIGELTSAMDLQEGANLTNQVDITVEMADYAIALIREVKKEVPDVTLTFTGGNDKYHHVMKSKARHPRGRAIDFIISPYSVGAYNKILNIIEGFAAGQNDEVRFIDEYKKLTTIGTGAHFHISWGKGSEGQKTAKAAVAKAEDDKLTKRYI